MEEVPIFLSKSSARRCDTLQDIMVVLSNSEDTRPRLRDIPKGIVSRERRGRLATAIEDSKDLPPKVDTEYICKPNQSMAH